MDSYINTYITDIKYRTTFVQNIYFMYDECIIYRYITHRDENILHIDYTFMLKSKLAYMHQILRNAD